MLVELSDNIHFPKQNYWNEKNMISGVESYTTPNFQYRKNEM